MCNIKLYEAYFDGKETLWEKVDYSQHMEFEQSHKSTYDYDEVIDLFDGIYNLYARDISDYDNNQYNIKNGSRSHWLNELEIFLFKKRCDIFIKCFEDEWYSMRVGTYDLLSDEEYNKCTYYIIDGMNGLRDLIGKDLTNHSHKHILPY